MVADERLTCLLALEVERDGGVAYVNRLVHYSAEIPALLKCCAGGPKLASFLERRPEVFAVSRRNPHSVVLVQPGAAAAVNSVANLGSAPAASESVLRGAAEALERRATYVLRQRASKLARRMHCDGPGSQQSPAAPLLWLVGKCKEELHTLVRLRPDRPVGVLVGTFEWKRLAAPGLLTLLEASDAFQINRPRADEQFEAVEVLLSDNASVGFAQNETAQESDPVCERILTLFEKNKYLGKEGGINVGRLLQDQDLRALLAGRDLQQYIRSIPAAARQFELFADKLRDDAVYIQPLRSVTAVDVVAGAVIADAVGSYSMTDRRSAAAMANALANAVQRVDLSSRGVLRDPEPGFEETSHTPASIATDTKQSNRTRLPAGGLHCIDMTAGVGGNTIACGKRFDSVLAFEINATRADLLRRNLSAAGLTDIVAVECSDSLAALPKLVETWAPLQLDTSERKVQAVAVVLDPPWGGIHYKRRRLEQPELRATSGHTVTDPIALRESFHSDTVDDGVPSMIAEDEALGLGTVPLTHVVALVAEHLGCVLPVVLGLKLPLTFDVPRWKARLQSVSESRGTFTMSVLSIKKLGRQLFAMLLLTSRPRSRPGPPA